MANEAIEYRKRIRERFDATALHRTKTLDGTTTIDIVKLDVVAQKISVSVPSTVTVTIEASIDSVKWVQLAAAQSNVVYTYGDTVGDQLVKLIRVTRTAGSGQVTVAAA